MPCLSLQITFAFSSADQQNNEFHRRYPFASTCWKEQVRTRLVLDSICKTGVCSHLVRRNMFPEKTKASFIGQIPLPVRKSIQGTLIAFLAPPAPVSTKSTASFSHWRIPSLVFRSELHFGNKEQDMRLPLPSILNSRTYQPYRQPLQAGETDNLTGGPSALSTVLRISKLCPPA